LATAPGFEVIFRPDSQVAEGARRIAATTAQSIG
jgi:hypothetical protein